MSPGVTPFAVSLPQLQKIIGSRSKSALRELREEFEDELEADREEVEEANGDDDFDPELTLTEALRHLIMDEERWDYEGAKYGFAVEMMCSFYGEHLPNDRWTGKPPTWAETVDDALLDAGVPEEQFSIFQHLILRGSPINIPDIEDFPQIGYVTLSEIPEILTALSDNRLQSIEHENSDEIRQSLNQVREWLETCQREKSDLICFCY
jgi:hypothetical protein